MKLRRSLYPRPEIFKESNAPRRGLERGVTPNSCLVAAVATVATAVCHRRAVIGCPAASAGPTGGSGVRRAVFLAQHGLQTTTGQADQAAERLGVLRRAQQRHLGWMGAHDEALRVQERAVVREDAWRRRVDQH